MQQWPASKLQYSASFPAPLTNYTHNTHNALLLSVPTLNALRLLGCILKERQDLRHGRLARCPQLAGSQDRELLL
eukprot:scaffold40570_cov17-Tisochrysis_lutea.AAC.3